jgi:hypothetical protein
MKTENLSCLLRNLKNTKLAASWIRVAQLCANTSVPRIKQAITASLDATPTTSCSNTIVTRIIIHVLSPRISTNLFSKADRPPHRSASPPTKTVSLVRASSYYEISGIISQSREMEMRSDTANTARRRQCGTGVRKYVLPADNFHILSQIYNSRLV